MRHRSYRPRHLQLRSVCLHFAKERSPNRESRILQALPNWARFSERNRCRSQSPWDPTRYPDHASPQGAKRWRKKSSYRERSPRPKGQPLFWVHCQARTDRRPEFSTALFHESSRSHSAPFRQGTTPRRYPTRGFVFESVALAGYSSSGSTARPFLSRKCSAPIGAGIVWKVIGDCVISKQSERSSA